MAKDVLYTNGVIAARETSLLGGKILKLCEMSAEDAFRSLTESGFGRGADALSVHEYEKVLAADARDIDAFIREYAPTNAEKAYFLSPRDFHNAKAIIKAKYTGAELAPMLAPDGLFTVGEIDECIQSGDCSPLYPELSEAVSLAEKAFSGENVVSGAEIGALFEKAAFKRLLTACKGNGLLKKFAVARADMTDILTAMRSQTPEYAATNYIGAGKLKAEDLEVLFCGDAQKSAERFAKTPYAEFVKDCFAAKEENAPFTAAEKALQSMESKYLSERRFELKRRQPFIYYVLRRRAENANMRIIFVCLLAGMDESYIKSRLRAV